MVMELLHELFVAFYLLSTVFAEASNGIIRTCPSKIVIHAKNYHKVYFAMEADRPVGLFPPLLTNISQSCCSYPVEIEMVNETSPLSILNLLYHERERLEREPEENGTIRLFFPVHTAERNPIFVHKEFRFVHIMKSPGPTFIMLKEELKDAAPDPSTVLLECWPIFLLLIIMAWAVGIIGWFLDHWKNSEQFPNNFYRGSWEGFWWAMVTMTTVGYGDKTPLSFSARVLTVLWMITGTIATSLFTANVTTVLTTKNVANLQRVMGQKVGVLNSKNFFQTEINEGASFVEFHDDQSLEDAFMKKQVSRMLVPNYLDHLYYITRRNLTEKNFVISNVIKHPFSIGLSLVNEIKDGDDDNIDFLRCWERSIMTNFEENAFDYSVLDSSLYDTVQDAKSLLNQASILRLIYGLIAVLVVFFVIGTLWELWKHKNRSSQKMDTLAPAEVEMTKVSELNF